MRLQELKISLLKKASTLDNPSLEVRLIIENVLNLPIEKQILNTNLFVEDEQILECEQILDKRISGYPMAYILGYKEFYGHKFKVNEKVLIPRPDTEILVEKAIELAKKIENPEILDLCTGSGAIAASIAYELGINTYLSDISPDALEVAKSNYKEITGKDAIARLGSLFEPWANKKFDIVATNPPYLTQKWYNETAEDVKKEPKIALIDKAEDGLDIIREIIELAPEHLNDNGYLLIEGDYRQMEKCAKLLSSKGFKSVGILKDLAGKDRVVYGKRE